MTAEIGWPEALRVLANGDDSLAGVEKVRKIYDLLKTPQLPLHAAELAEIERLRAAAKRSLARVGEIYNRAGVA